MEPSKEDTTMTLKVVHHITDLIGDTPCVRLQRLTGPQDAEVYVKLEYFNPSGSVKDRAAGNLIAEAEKAGHLQPGGTIIEPTSGNTGIGLAMNAAARGYRSILVMPSNMTKERQVADEDAIEMTRAIAAQEGILVGPSSGATIWTAIQEARRLGAGKRVLCIAPDTGERYLSMGIFG
jgi:cysteine synthase